jgi:hypothetical protein
VNGIAAHWLARSPASPSSPAWQPGSPSPTRRSRSRAPSRAIRRFFQDNAGAARINVAGQLVSAASLARFATCVAALAGDEGPAGRTLSAVTAASGGLSAASLAASAPTGLALTGPAGRGGASAVALHRRMFVLGGPVHTIALGVFVGCLSVAGRRTWRLPSRLTAAGLGAAAPAAMSSLSLVAHPAVLLIPAARVSGLVVCGIAGAHLSRR